jgi:hypothetical protein
VTAWDRLCMWMCGRVQPRESDTDTADELIDEAERTRRDLQQITDRLAAHVLALQVLTQAYTREREGPTGG